MFISILGLRSALGIWLVRLIRAIAEETLPDYSYIEATTVDELKQAWASGNRRALVVSVDAPSPQMAKLMQRFRSAVILVADDLVDTVGYFVDSTDRDLREAIRHSTRGVCLVHEFFLDPEIFLWQRENMNVLLRDVISQFDQRFEINLTEQQIGSVFNRLGVTHLQAATMTAEVHLLETIEHSRPRGVFYAEQSNDDKELLDRTLEGYLAVYHRRPILGVTWIRQTFSSHDVPSGARDIKLDLTGKARHLVFGPYLHLPTGRWNAVIRFAVDDILSGCSLLVDVVSGGVLTFGEIDDLPTRGVFSFDLDFEIVNPEFPVEIRIEMKHGSIEGIFMFGDTLLRRLR